MEFKPAASLTEQIADHLTNEIVAGRLSSRERIQELKVARELGVSRGSVREALLILEGRHLIEIVPRRGAVVSAFGPEDRAALSEMLAELWAYAFRKTAERVARHEVRIDVLDPPLQRMDEAVKDGSAEEVLRAKFAFIAAGIPATRNRFFASLMRSILPAAERLAMVASRCATFDARDTLRLAKALREAVAANDRNRIDELIRAHCRREANLAGENNKAHAERMAS
jgi:DNA-binding GntR family transcriptional regulator